MRGRWFYIVLPLVVFLGTLGYGELRVWMERERFALELNSLHQIAAEYKQAAEQKLTHANEQQQAMELELADAKDRQLQYEVFRSAEMLTFEVILADRIMNQTLRAVGSSPELEARVAQSTYWGVNDTNGLLGATEAYVVTYEAFNVAIVKKGGITPMGYMLSGAYGTPKRLEQARMGFLAAKQRCEVECKSPANIPLNIESGIRNALESSK